MLLPLRIDTDDSVFINTGYVPQDDIVHEDLTVHENIMLAHSLRGGFNELRDGKAVVDEVRLLLHSQNTASMLLCHLTRCVSGFMALQTAIHIGKSAFILLVTFHRQWLFGSGFDWHGRT